jgi:phospholipase/lecithinase/hemolysin
MITNVVLAFVLVLSWVFSLASQASTTFSISKVIAFGDSLSDNGNLYRHTKFYHRVNPNIAVVPEKPYYQGRFCNGLVWIEYLIKLLRLEHKPGAFIDYAYGGSWVEAYSVSKQIFPPYLEKQVDKFLAEASEDDLEAYLFTFWHGANDLLVIRDNLDQITTTIIALLEQQIIRLIDRGAKHFVVINMPDLGAIPYNVQLRPERVPEQRQASLIYNHKLSVMVADLQKRYSVDLAEINAFKSLRMIVDQNVYRGVSFRKTRFPCYKGRAALAHVNNHVENPALVLLEHVCSKPDEYAFWDWIHPSTKMNALIAEDAYDKLLSLGLTV